MKTDQLLDWLAEDARPIDPRRSHRRWQVAAAAGLLAAIALAAHRWGWRPLDEESWSSPMWWMRWLFCAWVVVAAGVMADRLGRPGRSVSRGWAWLLLPWAAMAAVGLASWWSADPQDRWVLLMGDTALQCPGNIASVALPAFLATAWCMKRMAPTRPAWAGAAAGLMAGATGAWGYTFHCPELTAPFIAVWYPLGMAIPAVLGAVLGRFSYRW